MLPAPANAPTPEVAPVPSADGVLSAWRANQAATGRGNPASDWAARSFLARWPHPQDWADQSLAARLDLAPSTMSLLMFLMVQGWLRPGWDWLAAKKLSSFWREIEGSRLEADMSRFCDTAVIVGFTEIQAKRAASQSVGRLLIQTGRPLEALTVGDLDELAAACRARE
ncbi:MAG TPA: integrase, partial [Actinomycetota bacterium]|nr:integrase [Actinomycetota bacterium]